MSLFAHLAYTSPKLDKITQPFDQAIATNINDKTDKFGMTSTTSV